MSVIQTLAMPAGRAVGHGCTVASRQRWSVQEISDPGKLMACAGRALENSSCGESLPIGVDGGSANEKPGNALLYVF